MTDMGNLQRWDGFDAAVYKLPTSTPRDSVA